MRRENVPGFLRSPRRAQVKTTPERFVLGFIKFLGTPLAVAALLAAMVAVTRAREGNWEHAALAASIAIACGGRGHRRDLVGSLARARRRSIGATACGKSRHAVDVARGLGGGRGPHVGEARRKSPDGHRDRMVRRNVPDLLHRAPSRAPRRRLLLAAIFDIPAYRRRDADMGDAHAAALPRIRRVALRDGFSAGTNRRLAHRLDSYRPPFPPDSKSRSKSNASTARRAATGTV